ncbi:MAG: TRAP transporter substrate-binding protein [Deltaproteobacteria bacterium]|nr:TRAP transporter substrate-binding protein [Deltaproteobacteria bacterium]MBW2725262.1 TRAP transporter substrate-binding protein [Deltaproteobacteria bacterium]
MADPSPAASPLPSSTRGGVSNRAALVAVLTAFLVGGLTTLALRPAGSAVQSRASQGSISKVRWKLPVAFGTQLPALGDNALFLAEKVAATSGGSIVLDVYEPGAVVPPFSIVEAVKEGKVDAGYTWLGYDQGIIPASVLFGAVPFGMEPWEYAAWWYYGDGRALGEEVYGALGIHPIFCGVIGPETAGWFRDEIKSLDDIKGLKIRFAGLGGMVMQELGASVTMLPGGEIFQALEKGAIDATEFSMPAIDARLGFDRVVSYNYYPGWHQPFTAFHLVVNSASWEALAESQQAALDTSCTAAVVNSLAKGEALQGAVIEEFRAKGVKVRSLPEPLLRELSRVTERVLERQRAKSPEFSRVLDSQQAFSARYANWKRLGFLPRDF